VFAFRDIKIGDLVDSLKKVKTLCSSEESKVADWRDANDRREFVEIVSHTSYPHKEFWKVYGCICSVMYTDCEYPNTIE
jgi:hypothetical protein